MGRLSSHGISIVSCDSIALFTGDEQERLGHNATGCVDLQGKGTGNCQAVLLKFSCEVAVCNTKYLETSTGTATLSLRVFSHCTWPSAVKLFIAASSVIVELSCLHACAGSVPWCV